MSNVKRSDFFRLRGHLCLRARGRYAIRKLLSFVPGWEERDKLRTESKFWVDIWDAKLRTGQFWNEDVETLLQTANNWHPVGAYSQLTYLDIRQMEAHAHGLRILKEVRIDDFDFFNDKIVVDIGPGAVCFLETSSARLGIAIEPLARDFAAHGLLLPSDHTIYLPVDAEEIPLLDNLADVVVSRNNLDHVEDPHKVVDEVFRILKPGGYFILIVHLEPETTITEPYALEYDEIRRYIRRFEIVQESINAGGRTEAGKTLAGLYKKP
jgi:SAM-dependent methyltransferase